jgi:hypothetical protein
MSIQQTPGQNFDTLYPAKCLAEPTGLVLPGTYRLSFEFPAAAFAVDLNRQLLVSVGVAAYDSPETSTVKVLVGSTRYPSQIWLTGSEGRPE